MIKVLQVVGIMNRGGAELMLMDILRNKTADVDFAFLVNHPKGQENETGSFDEEIIKSGAKIYHIGSQFNIGPLEYARQFKRIIKEYKPNIVHSHLNAKSGIIAWAAHKAGVKHFIAHCHADIRFRGAKLKVFLNEIEMFIQKLLISRYATDFWGCSIEANKRLFYKKQLSKAIVINNAIDCQSYAQLDENKVKKIRESYGFSKGTLILGNVGRIVRHKNILHIVHLLPILRSKGIDAALVVAGRMDDNDYVHEIKNYAKENNLENRILFLGERKDVPEVMRSFDIFIGTALKEGFGMVAVEAQAAGIPTILYTGFPKAVNMGLGITTFIDNFKHEEWVNSMINYCNTKRDDLDNIAKIISEKGFDCKSNAEYVCSLYKKIASQNHE